MHLFIFYQHFQNAVQKPPEKSRKLHLDKWWITVIDSVNVQGFIGFSLLMFRSNGDLIAAGESSVLFS